MAIASQLNYVPHPVQASNSCIAAIAATHSVFTILCDPFATLVQETAIIAFDLQAKRPAMPCTHRANQRTRADNAPANTACNHTRAPDRASRPRPSTQLLPQLGRGVGHVGRLDGADGRAHEGARGSAECVLRA